MTPTPKAGYEFVLLNVTVTNPTRNSLLLMPVFFQVRYSKDLHYYPLAPKQNIACATKCHLE